MTRTETALLVAGTLLLAIGIVRLAIPDRSRIRPLSIEAISIPSEPIKSGESIERVVDWSPPADVYIVGWGPRVNARNSGAEMLLFVKGPPETLLFDYVEDGRPGRSEYTAPSTGFRVAKGSPLRLRFRLNNGGPDSATHGASALIYFVPADGN